MPQTKGPLNAEQALEVAATHAATLVADRVRADGSVSDGWPEGAYRTTTEPVWTVFIPNEVPSIGSSRVVCVSKISGKVLFDGRVGE